MNEGEILGHSTIQVTMRYAHFAPKAGRAGIDKLGKALQGGAGDPGADAGSGGAVGSGVVEAAVRYAARRTG